MAVLSSDCYMTKKPHETKIKDCTEVKKQTRTISIPSPTDSDASLAYCIAKRHPSRTPYSTVLPSTLFSPVLFSHPWTSPPLQHKYKCTSVSVLPSYVIPLSNALIVFILPRLPSLICCRYPQHRHYSPISRVAILPDGVYTTLLSIPELIAVPSPEYNLVALICLSNQILLPPKIAKYSHFACSSSPSTLSENTHIVQVADLRWAPKTSWRTWASAASATSFLSKPRPHCQ